MRRAVLHVDLDAFFAAVEQRDDPALRGRPVLVGGEGPRGVVATASYEARVYGCRSAQPMAVAKRLCPQAIVVRPRGDAYREASERVFAIFERFAPLVEPLSLDEAFLDVTGSRLAKGDEVSIAREIKRLVREETGLTASIGVAPNKLVAKIASDLEKPDGLVVVEEGELQERLAPLEITRLWGVGPKGAERLAALGVRTFGDMQRLSMETLRGMFGEHGESLWRRCRGMDDRPVVPDHEAKSISHESTFPFDVGDVEVVRAVLMDHTEQVARRLRAKGRRGRTVTVKIRFGEFETVTRSETLSEATNRTDAIWAAGRRLFDAWARGFRPVRLIGIGVSQLTEGGEQLGLFEASEARRKAALDATADAINARFGKRMIRRASGVEPRDSGWVRRRGVD